MLKGFLGVSLFSGGLSPYVEPTPPVAGYAYWVDDAQPWGSTQFSDIEGKIPAQIGGSIGSWKDPVNNVAATITAGGEVSLAPGKIGNGVRFDGTGYLSVSSRPSLRIRNAFSIEMFVLLTNTSNVQVLLDKTNAASERSYFLFISSPGVLTFRVYNTTSDYFDANVSGITTNTYYHIVCIFDGVRPYLSVNAVLTNGAAFSGTIVSNTSQPLSLFIGGRVTFNYPIVNGGIIDELRFYHVALTAPQITTLYNGGNGLTLAQAIAAGIPSPAHAWNFDNDYRDQIDPAYPSPVAEWSLGGDGGYVDKIGSRVLTPQGTGTTTAAGVIGDAASFNGSGWLSTPDVDVFRSAFSMALEAWIRPTDVSTVQRIITRDDLGSARDFTFYITTGGIVGGGWWNASGILVQALSGAGAIMVNQWNHVVLCLGADGVARLYHQGILTATAASPQTTLRVTTGLPLRIAGDGLYNLAGRVDEPRIWQFGASGDPGDTFWRARSQGITSPTVGGADLQKSAPTYASRRPSRNTAPTFVRSSVHLLHSLARPATETLYVVSKVNDVGYPYLTHGNTNAIKSLRHGNPEALSVNNGAQIDNFITPASTSTFKPIRISAVVFDGVNSVNQVFDDIATGNTGTSTGTSTTIGDPLSTLNDSILGFVQYLGTAHDATQRAQIIDFLAKRLAPIPAPAHYWRFDGDYTDTHGGATLTPGGTGNSFAAAKIDQGLVLNGSGWAEVADQPSLRVRQNMSWSFWINRPATANVVYVAKDNNSSNREWLFWSDHVSGVIFVLHNANGDQFIVNSNFAANTLTHVCVTFNGTTLRMFINGTQTSTATFTGNLPVFTAPLQFGRNVVIPPTTCTIDEFAIFHCTLTPDEIATLYWGGAGRRPREIAEYPAPDDSVYTFEGEIFETVEGDALLTC